MPGHIILFGKHDRTTITANLCLLESYPEGFVQICPNSKNFRTLNFTKLSNHHTHILTYSLDLVRFPAPLTIGELGNLTSLDPYSGLDPNSGLDHYSGLSHPKTQIKCGSFVFGGRQILDLKKLAFLWQACGQANPESLVKGGGRQ